MSISKSKRIMISRYKNRKYKYRKYNITDILPGMSETCVILKGTLHRSNGPAYFYTKSDGTIYSEKWYIYGKIHRANGLTFTKFHL